MSLLWKIRTLLIPWKYKRNHFMPLPAFEIYLVLWMFLSFYKTVYTLNMTGRDNNISLLRYSLPKKLKMIHLNLQHLSDRYNKSPKLTYKKNSRSNSHRKSIYTRRNMETRLHSNLAVNLRGRVYDKNRQSKISKVREKRKSRYKDDKSNYRSRNTGHYKARMLGKEFSSSWAIRIPKIFHDIENPRVIVENIINSLDLHIHGNIGHLPGHFLVVHNSFYNHTPEVSDELYDLRREITTKLSQHPHIEWVQHEVVIKRYRRALEFQDQFFPSQWHLDNIKFVGHDINVTGVWENNVTGKGVTVSVIDDGVEWTNPDILDNYSAKGSWDLNSNDGDPMPRVDEAGLNHHGTRCAGEIAAVANEYCAVGVAFGSKVSGIRILDGPMTDSLEAMAFNTKSNVNDIYSCSWGPDDNGRTVDGPHHLAQAALATGVMTGRHGYGSIFVVASGNGGHFHDNCNFDGYANSIFTVTIGAVDELNQMPYYAEQCAAMLAVTYSSGQGHQRNIVTTDWRLGTGTGCTDRHTGTSAAAPLAAGVIALMLEARSCLTWRDVQHLIVYTSVRVDVDPEEWQTNGAGFAHSHKHGFGLLDSWRLVTSSRVNIKHPSRGTLAVSLISPYGTISRLASTRKYDKSTEGFTDWTFSTVRCWGEHPVGLWKFIITDKGDNKKKGLLKSWRLTFYGSSMSYEDILERKRLVKKAFSGKYFHAKGPPCPAPSSKETEKDVISPKILKVILLLSGFLFMVALYFIVEALCSQEEKPVVVETELEQTMEIQTPEGFDLESFIPKTLARDDEVRLSNIIEHGQTSCSFADEDMLIDEIERTAKETPDEITRVQEFENRLNFALEQSLLLQMKQMNQIDNLEHDLKELMGTKGLGEVDVFQEIPKKKAKKKLKGILKKPKQYKD